jgi:hypothetical protein
VGPARIVTESLTQDPELENSQGHDLPLRQRSSDGRFAPANTVLAVDRQRDAKSTCAIVSLARYARPT